MKISSWGNCLNIDAHVLTPAFRTDAQCCIPSSVIARGMGRSYGDSALADKIFQTTYLDNCIHFDHENGVVECESGLVLRDLLNIILPKGWFLPVTPGTSYVSVGGAIASDVHGKNHHKLGTFGQHLKSIKLMTGDGSVVDCSPDLLPDLFYATCGGMGLTGIILCAQIKLHRITSTFISQTTIKANCLEDLAERFDANSASTYSVAWVDCLANERNLGRSILMLGEHSQYGEIELPKTNYFSVPKNFPSPLLNKYSISVFNQLYYAKARNRADINVSLDSYFYPLDSILNWNRMYGRKGFLQYQFVIPREAGLNELKKILRIISNSGKGSFLAVLKLFGKGNQNMLSFPMEGYTLALDFKLNSEVMLLLRKLDEIVLSAGGRLYLTKDSIMTEATFKQSYPRWDEFEMIREKYKAIGKFRSLQSTRLGLK